MANTPKFARLRSITAAVLKLKPGQPRFFFVRSAAFTGKKIDDKKEAATLIYAADMETGEEGLVLLTSVMKKELFEAYPGESYVGRGFEMCITKAADPAAGVRYNHISLAEVSLPDDFVRPGCLNADGSPVGSDTAPAKGKGK
jgi:hypothetical protein